MTQSRMDKESRALLSSLAAQRNHVLGILEGVSEQDLRRPILPSQWTCAGLVHHLAIDVERFWFRAVVAGEPMPDDDPDNAWQVPADLAATAVLDGYRRAGTPAVGRVAPHPPRHAPALAAGGLVCMLRAFHRPHGPLLRFVCIPRPRA